MKHMFLIAGAALIGYTLWKKNQGAPVNTLPPTGISNAVPMPFAPPSNGSDDSLGTDAAGNSLSQLPSPDAVTHSVEMMDFEHINPFSTSAM